jgi:hypothetical protein
MADSERLVDHESAATWARKGSISCGAVDHESADWWITGRAPLKLVGVVAWWEVGDVEGIVVEVVRRRGVEVVGLALLGDRAGAWGRVGDGRWGHVAKSSRPSSAEIA